MKESSLFGIFILITIGVIVISMIHTGKIDLPRFQGTESLMDLADTFDFKGMTIESYVTESYYTNRYGQQLIARSSVTHSSDSIQLRSTTAAPGGITSTVTLDSAIILISEDFRDLEMLQFTSESGLSGTRGSSGFSRSSLTVYITDEVSEISVYGISKTDLTDYSQGYTVSLINIELEKKGNEVYSRDYNGNAQKTDISGLDPGKPWHIKIVLYSSSQETTTTAVMTITDIHAIMTPDPIPKPDIMTPDPIPKPDISDRSDTGQDQDQDQEIPDTPIPDGMPGTDDILNPKISINTGLLIVAAILFISLILIGLNRKK